MGARQRFAACVQGWNDTLQWLSHTRLAMELSPLICLHLHAQHSTCHIQADIYANMPKPHRQSKRAHWYWAALPVYAIIFKAHSPHLFPLFPSLSRQPTGKTGCRRTADSNSFSSSQCLLQTFTEYFDFNKSKWATQPCFIKGTPDWGKYWFFTQLCCFPQENRCYSGSADDCKFH